MADLPTIVDTIQHNIYDYSIGYILMLASIDVFYYQDIGHELR